MAIPIVDLTTERLRIRQFEAGDLDACIRFRREEYAVEEAPEVAERWLNWTIDSYREMANLGQPPYADYAIVLRESGKFVGAAGIVPTMVPWGALNGDPSDSLLSPEVGLYWSISLEHRRRGYASEAGQALLDYLFDRLGMRQVVATTENDNIASQRTMTKLGMTLQRNPFAEPSWCQIVGKIRNTR